MWRWSPEDATLLIETENCNNKGEFRYYPETWLICVSVYHRDSMKTKNLERPRDLVWGQTPRPGLNSPISDWIHVENFKNGSGNGSYLDREWMRSKNVAIERIPTGFVLAIFVDDRPFHSDPLYKHANVQSKAVFSNALTVMEKIDGNEEKWEGKFKVRGVHVDLHQDGACRVAEAHSEMQENLKRQMSFIMLWVNWVCARAFKDHEWVSESTIRAKRRRRRRSDGQGFGSRNLYSARGTIVHVVILPPTWLNEVSKLLDLTITEAISRPFRHLHTQRTCMSILLATSRKWGVNKEMEGLEMERRPELFLCWWWRWWMLLWKIGIWKPRPRSLRDHAPCVSLVFVLLSQIEDLSKVKKKNVVCVPRPKSVKDVETKSRMASQKSHWPQFGGEEDGQKFAYNVSSQVERDLCRLK